MPARCCLPLPAVTGFNQIPFGFNGQPAAVAPQLLIPKTAYTVLSTSGIRGVMLSAFVDAHPLIANVSSRMCMHGACGTLHPAMKPTWLPHAQNRPVIAALRLVNPFGPVFDFGFCNQPPTGMCGKWAEVVAGRCCRTEREHPSCIHPLAPSPPWRSGHAGPARAVR